MGSLAISRLSIIETLRRKEFYVVLILVIGLAVWIHSMDLGASGAGRFSKDVVMQVIWLASFALAVPLAARQISSDIEQRTIYILVSRPIHRWHYVFGRALGATAATVACFTGLFLVLVSMLLIKRTGGALDASLWQAFVLQVAALVMLCATTIFFSVFSTPAAAVTFSLVLLVVMRYGGIPVLHSIEQMPAIVRESVWAAYLVLPHFEFFNISQRVVHGWGPLPVRLFLQVIVYGIAYSIFVTACAAYIFKRRWL